jgi:predicted  nucleic acid-binding Zn-ribbon protein
MDNPTEDGTSADLPIDMSQAKRLMTQLRGELARVKIERDTLAHGLRLANEHRAEQEAKIIKLGEELDEDYELRERLGKILTNTANALKGQPDPLMLHSWHDLAEWASAARAAADAAVCLNDHGIVREPAVSAWVDLVRKDTQETADALALYHAPQRAGTPE